MTEQQLDDYYVHVAHIIAEHGWIVQAVMADAPGVTPFAYTAGLSLQGLPDLYVFNLPPAMAQDILNLLAQMMIDGRRFTSGETVDLDYSVQFKVRGPVDLQQAEAFLARQVAPLDAPATLWQVLWPDTEGRFPDDEGYDSAKFPQQVIDEAEEQHGERHSQEG